MTNSKTDKPARDKKQVDRAIRATGLEIIRGQGYFYFLDIKTGHQAGESVPVCYFYHLKLSRWLAEAEEAAAVFAIDQKKSEEFTKRHPEGEPLVLGVARF